LCETAIHKQFRSGDVTAVADATKNFGPGNLIGCAEPGSGMMLDIIFKRVDSISSYDCFSRSGFNAPPQAMTWSSIELTDLSCWEAGLKTLKFSKSVKSESTTCAFTSATCSSLATSLRVAIQLEDPAVLRHRSI
jgi:hypothetical protein